LIYPGQPEAVNIRIYAVFAQNQTPSIPPGTRFEELGARDWKQGARKKVTAHYQ